MRWRYRNSKSLTYPSFKCVECGTSVAPTHARAKATTYSEELIRKGERNAGPHCRTCADQYMRVLMFRERLESLEREKNRVAAFDRTAKPADVDGHIWGIMRQYACCPEARHQHCVCMWSFACAKHGATHVGTHD